jgi:hypothetical protein
MELSADEREYLLELLQTAHDEMLHELHHTDTRSFEETLKQRVALNEQITRRLETATA